MNNLIQLYKTNDYINFFINYLDYFWNSLIEIILSIFVILNHLSIIHIKALYDSYYNVKKDKRINKSYLYLNLIIFKEKWLDIFIFIISIIRIININFYCHLLHQKRFFFFDLLINNEKLLEKDFNKERRYDIILQVIIDFFINILMILNFLLGILNPFLTLKIIKHLFLYFITCKNQTEIKFEDIEFGFIHKSIKNMKIIFYVDFIYLPISLILNIFAFWTIKYNISLVISNNKKSCNNFKNIHNKSIEYVNKNYNLEKKYDLNKYNENLGIICNSLCNGYALIFKLTVIFLNIFRIFILWSKVRKNKKQYYLSYIIWKQYNLAIIELIYLPFLICILILQPWNYEIIQEFLKAKNCSTKFQKFKHLFVRFFKDFFYIFIFLLLMITLIDTITTLLLVFRSIKRKLFPSEENKLTYALKYKTENFRTELIQIYNKNVKKIITTFLFLLNILLISRIIPLFRQTWPFFKQFFNKMKTNFKKIFLCKKKNAIENDKLSKMPYIIISEICSFLKVNEVSNLNLTNKKINEKTNINYIWENIYNNKYDKLLKEVLDDKEYKKFSKIDVENYKESCKYSVSIILEKKGRNVQQIKTFSEIVREETINSLLNLIYLIKIIIIMIPIFLAYVIIYIINIPVYINKYINIILSEIFNFLSAKLNVSKYEYFNPIEDDSDSFFLFIIFKRIFIIKFQLIINCFIIFLIPQLFLGYILIFLSFILYKLNKVLIFITQIERFYEKSLVIDIYNPQKTNILIFNIKAIIYIIIQVSIIFYLIFLIPQLLLKYIFGFLNIFLYNIYESLINIFSYKRIYEKELITKTYTDKTLNPIIVNITQISIIILQIVIIIYFIFLIPQIFLKYILEIINLSIYIIYEFLINSLKIKKLYEKELITNLYIDKSFNPILVNIKGIFITVIQIIMISYCIFLIPQIILRVVLKYLNLTLYKIYDFLVIQFSLKKIYEKSLIVNIYDNKELNPIIANLQGIFIVIIQVIIISYFIFLTSQVMLRFIFENINLILYKINDFLSNKFILKRFYEKILITEIYDDKTKNPIVSNIKGLFIIIFQTIIISYNLFMIPQLILRYILKNLNLLLYEICNFLANMFTIIKFYERTLITNIYDDKTFNPIIVNIEGISIMIFQIIIIAYTIFLIPQIISIKFIACNFNKKSSDLSLDERVQSCSFFMLLIQLIYGLLYFIINYTICISPSLYYIFIDLDFKSKNNFKQTIKDLTEIIYYSNFMQFTQIFFGKYYLNLLIYFLNKFMATHTVIFLSKTTDIIFVKILDNLFSQFFKIIPISIYFPLKYVLKYIGISFKAISIKIKNISKYLDIILNIFALTICIIPFYLLYVCFENDSKKIIFIEVPIFIYLVFNMWICGKAISEIEKQYGTF